MAFAVAIPTRVPREHRDFGFWMDRTLQRLAEVRAEPSADAVHDVRVALRRCRSVATAVEEIDPHPAWQEVRGCARKMFRAMGELRDAQVLEGLIQGHGPRDERLQGELVHSLKGAQAEALGKALRLAAKFDEKLWHELSRTLRSRLKIMPVDGEAARCLALERLTEAQELHRRALRTEKPRPWHELRIGLKRFRYTLELLVPSLHDRWISSLKRVQDLLGEVHDFDVLCETADRSAGEMPAEVLEAWRKHLAAVREQKLQTYRQLTLGDTGLWQSWLGSFPRHEWPRLSTGRIAATRKAMDRKRRRSLAVSRIARRLWSGLRICGAHAFFADADQKRVMEAAALLSGIRPLQGKKSRVKSARTFLLDTPVPPGWTLEEWERVAWTIRFQRGAEPATHHRKFAKLGAEQRSAVGMLGGILRLAVAAQRSGVRSGRFIKVEALPDGILLRVNGIEETPQVAIRFAEARLLLERSLGKTIFVKTVKDTETPQPSEGAALPGVAIIG